VCRRGRGCVCVGGGGGNFLSGLLGAERKGQGEKMGGPLARKGGGDEEGRTD
jgi:hypothetical protein